MRMFGTLVFALAAVAAAAQTVTLKMIPPPSDVAVVEPVTPPRAGSAAPRAQPSAAPTAGAAPAAPRIVLWPSARNL